MSKLTPWQLAIHSTTTTSALTMLTLDQLPLELLTHLLEHALQDNAFPTNVLCVNFQFFTIGQRMLHSHLRFRHLSQIAEFAAGTSPLTRKPHGFTVEISAGTGASSTDAAFSRSVFRYLIPVLRRCGAEPAENSPTGKPMQLPLDILELYLNTHVRDLHLRYVYDALSLTK